MQMQKNGLVCPDFCSCSEEDEPCDNAEVDEDLETDESSDEDYKGGSNSL